MLCVVCLVGYHGALEQLVQLVARCAAHERRLVLLGTQEMSDALETLSDARTQVTGRGRECSLLLALENGAAYALGGRMHLREPRAVRVAREGAE